MARNYRCDKQLIGPTDSFFQEQSHNEEDCQYWNGVWVQPHTNNGKHIKGYCRSNPHRWR